MTLTKHTILNSRTRGRWALGAAAAVALGITIGMTSALHATSTQQRPQLAATSSLPASFADLVDYASPSVVAIRTMGPAKTVSALQLPPGLPFAEQFRRYFEYHDWAQVRSKRLWLHYRCRRADRDQSSCD